MDEGSTATSVRVYRVGPLRRAVPLAVFGLPAAVLGASALTAADLDTRQALGLVAGALAVFGGLVYLLTRYPRLVVSAEGLAQHQIGWTIRTTWENVARLERGRGMLGFVLTAPLTGRGAAALRVGRFLPAWYSAEQDGFVEEGRWFPLEPFAWQFRHGNLADDIRRCAPRLLDSRAIEQ
jgi:hypothetical protein